MVADDYIGEGDIPYFHRIQIDVQIRTFAFKVVITGSLYVVQAVKYTHAKWPSLNCHI